MKLDPYSWGRESAKAALDQWREWGSIEKSIENYAINLVDTLDDYGINTVANRTVSFWAFYSYLAPYAFDDNNKLFNGADANMGEIK